MLRKRSGKKTDEELGVTDLLLLDHRFLKNCIEVLLDERSGKRKKLSTARDFLENFRSHSLAERQSVYVYFAENEELHFGVIEALAEHGTLDRRVRSLSSKVSRCVNLSGELEAELKDLAHLLKEHLEHEEEHLIPKMRDSVDDDSLRELGEQFLKLRGGPWRSKSKRGLELHE